MPAVSWTATRRLPRISATLTLSLLPKSRLDEGARDAYTVDLSPLGARIRTTLALSAGELVDLIGTCDSAQCVPCRVVWAQRSYPAGSVAGLEFLTPPPVPASDPSPQA